ncbi:hypothetical protein BGZ65_007227 [Modicella reniformis]|uniref:FHA domain-containing protein n=1 Tax=Modicella reniformis TaxID=1440133 RepID=A0A9P6JH58_9FUNG|nr:hypothetical protein BGZ65_007227 [Modicella reniformis]
MSDTGIVDRRETEAWLPDWAPLLLPPTEVMDHGDTQAAQSHDDIKDEDEDSHSSVEQSMTLKQEDNQSPDDDHVKDRRFTFLQNALLLLGRAPSCGSYFKTRQRQSDDANQFHELARADDDSDGLFANQVISKIHAAIYEQDGSLVLEDRNSTHGTFVNNIKIERRILQDSDHVRLGRRVVRNGIPYLPLEFIIRIQGMDKDNRSDNCVFPVVVSGTEAVASESTDTNRKRKLPDDLSHTAPTARKRTALVAAALAGVVVGSVGTVLTLANM